MDDSSTYDELERLLVAGEDALEARDYLAVRDVIADMRQVTAQEPAQAPYLEGLLEWQLAGPEAAHERLLEAVAIDPNDADIRHALALACEALGDGEGMRRHFMQTRILDARADREAGIGSERELDFIEQTAADTLERLPEAFRSRLHNVTITLEPRPSMRLVSEGFDPRAYGVFDAPVLIDDALPEAAPSRIVLFTANLLTATRDGEALARQVEITMLHEIAHYFGFEEADMARLGLQ